MTGITYHLAGYSNLLHIKIKKINATRMRTLRANVNKPE
jgi:hypothetical protein